MACKDVEVSKHGAQIEWDELIAQYDKPKESESHESEEELDDIDHRRQKKDHRPSDDENLLGMLLLPIAMYSCLLKETLY